MSHLVMSMRGALGAAPLGTALVIGGGSTSSPLPWLRRCPRRQYQNGVKMKTKGQTEMEFEVSDEHEDESSDCGLLGYDTVSSCRCGRTDGWMPPRHHVFPNDMFLRNVCSHPQAHKTTRRHNPEGHNLRWRFLKADSFKQRPQFRNYPYCSIRCM